MTAKHNLRIPFRLQVLFGSRVFFTVFAVVMAVFSLYGPLPARLADHNGYRYLLGPLVSPLIALTIALLFPYNPYSNWTRERFLRRLDERDENARRFVEILRSPTCRRVAIAASARLAGLLIVVMGAMTIIFRDSLSWTPLSRWFYPGLAGAVLFAWMFLKVQVVSWALLTFWKTSAGESGNGEHSRP